MFLGLKFNLQKLFIKKLLLLIVLALTSSVSHAKVNWQLYESNSFFWGQTTGCMLRLSVYMDMGQNPEQTRNAVLPLLPDFYLNYEKMSQIGIKNGHVGAEMPMDAFEDMVKTFAEGEWESGDSFMQTIGCYDLLVVQGFGKR